GACATPGCRSTGSRKTGGCSCRRRPRSRSPTRSSRSTSPTTRSASDAARTEVMADAPLLEARAVSRTYPGVTNVAAVREVSFALPRREFGLVMGPSGSGKTTFLGMLAGFDEPDRGQVRWLGRPFGELGRDELLEGRRAGLAVIFHSYGLLPSLSAVENVELPLRVAGVDLGEARERASGWLDRLRPGPRAPHREIPP